MITNSNISKIYRDTNIDESSIFLMLYKSPNLKISYLARGSQQFNMPICSQVTCD